MSTTASTLSPEYRRDPVTGRWVIIAPERALRPLSLSNAKPHLRRDAERDTCPFCPGAEAGTTEELYSLRDANTRPGEAGWSLRVIANKFPAVRPVPGGALIHTGMFLYEARPGFGLHEVVIECAAHRSNPVELTDAEFTAVLVAYRERVKALSADPRVAYVTVFKNVGAEAGASLAHTHSQVVATPVVPDAVRHELDGAKEHHQLFRRCVFCHILEQEAAAAVRVIAETPGFVAVSPFAPRFAYETWVLPKTHDSRYEAATDTALAELAGLMRRLLGKLDAALGYPAYNYYIHTGPARSDPLPHYHWHLEIIPRTARQAGFEWGTGCFINAVAPERAAAELRTAEPIYGADPA